MTREEILDALNRYTDGRNDDDTLAFIQTIKGFADEVDGIVAKAVAEKDTEWRDKYRKAFFDGGDATEKDTDWRDAARESAKKRMTLDDLFIERNNV